MDEFREVWDDGWGFFESKPYPQALVIIVVFFALAWLADRVFSGSIKRLVARSETDFDDRLVDILHRPIRATVLLIGLIIATHRLGLSDDSERITVLIVSTLLIFVWVSFGRRFSRLILATMRRDPDRFTFVQESTEPLLSNAVAVLLFLVAAYTILVAWGHQHHRPRGVCRDHRPCPQLRRTRHTLESVRWGCHPVGPAVQDR